MEKERSTKIIAVVALVAAVLGLTIGFAAYSSTWDITDLDATVKPGESKEFTLVMYMTYDETEINKIKEDVTEIRRINTDKEIEKIEEYWQKFVEKHDTYKILSKRKYSPKFKEIYKRTILSIESL